MFCMDSVNFWQMHNQSFDNIHVQQCMPHIPSDKDITFEDSNPTFESDFASSKSHSVAWHLVINEQFSKTWHFTLSYNKLLGWVPTSSTLPKGRNTYTRWPEDQSNILFNFVEDLIKNSLQEIPIPLDQIPPTPCGPTPPGLKHHSDGEHSGYDSEDNMARNQTIVMPWMSQGYLNLPGPSLEFPKWPEILLSKFDLDKA